MITSSKEITALKPKEKRYSIAIENGLTLRVHPSGSKSWLVRTTLNGRTVDITLGHFPDMSLAQAKQAARRKQKEFDVKPIGGYTLKDAFVLWCNLKRGRIVSYKGKQLSAKSRKLLFIVIAKQFDIRPVYNSPWAIS